ncbi:condensation domain-containing protein [Micromonospora sp. C95]|uniref:condensation domain-containing protein n=1 Tax=Micromonospora sp. C95 TaxID=2824882 RepID=UPI001B37CC82|nr:condensation domain-containing protein [Micromonospora sp. C95]MBQ1026047.1 hypothetical protein [Micromonospora sp. C95]
MEKTGRVRFSGATGGTFPATWSQREFWHTINKKQPSGYYQIPWAVPIPPGCRLDRIEQILASFAIKYEALRTTLRRDPDGELRQIVHSEGVIPTWSASLPPDRAAITASGPLKEFLESEPAVDREFPWKIVVLTWNGSPHHLVCVCSHMVLDGQSGALLAAEMREALTADVEAGDTSAGDPVWQPSDLARWETAAGGRKVSQRALDHWRSVLAGAPASPFPSAARKGASPLWRGLLRSTAVEAAEQAVIGRTGLSSSSLFLSAAASLLWLVTGSSCFLFRVPTNNRVSRDLQGYVGALQQHALVKVDVRCDTFDELMRSVAGNLLRAQSRARYDGDGLYGMLEELSSTRAGQPDLTLLFNDLRPTYQRPQGRPLPTDSGADRDAPEVTWELLHTTNPDITLYVRLADARGVLSLDVAADESCMPKPEIEGFVQAMESLLTHAAHSNFPLSDIQRVASGRPATTAPSRRR